MEKQTMDDNEKFFFDAAFKQVVDAIASVLEKPEFDKPKIQNLVLLELIGHTALSMHQGAVAVGEDVEEAAVETLTRYLGFIIQTIQAGGIESLGITGSKPQVVN